MQIRALTLTSVLGALLLGLSASSAVASGQATGMTEAQVTTKLQAAGYTKVHGVKREGKHFDADATKDGRTVHLHVDAATGAVSEVADESEEEEKAESHY